MPVAQQVWIFNSATILIMLMLGKLMCVLSKLAGNHLDAVFCQRERARELGETLYYCHTSHPTQIS